MKKIVVMLALAFSFSAQAKTIKIAVIDTGFDFKSDWKRHAGKGYVKPKLCDSGHWDFAKSNNKPQDTHGHGTHVAGIIAKHLKDIDYCLVILKYYDANATGAQALLRSNAALLKAYTLRVDYINYSGGGIEPQNQEKTIINMILDRGIKIFAAAGNESKSLSIQPYYPAMYDSRIYVAGSTDNMGRILATSNRGFGVDKYLVGKDVISLGLNNRLVPMTGTSQATPLYLSQEIRKALGK